MQVTILDARTGNAFRQVSHNDQRYLVVPRKGPYHIRLHNDSPKRRLAVVSVDGQNVLTGEKASKDDEGYVLDPWDTMTIKGWHRTNSEVAEFGFDEKSHSYSAKMGKGTKNTSVIGVAVFDEKTYPKFEVKPVVRIVEHHYPPWWPWTPPYPRRTWWDYDVTWGTSHSTYTNTGGGTRSCSSNTIAPQNASPTTDCFFMSAQDSLGDSDWSEPLNLEPNRDVTDTLVEGAKEPLAEMAAVCASASAAEEADPGQTKGGKTSRSASPDLGTTYGKRAEMHVREVDFERASEHPVQVITIRYAVKEKLKEWGIPVDRLLSEPSPAPEAFPAERVACAAPSGWEG